MAGSSLLLLLDDIAAVLDAGRVPADADAAVAALSAHLSDLEAFARDVELELARQLTGERGAEGLQLWDVLGRDLVDRQLQRPTLDTLPLALQSVAAG